MEEVDRPIHVTTKEQLDSQPCTECGKVECNTKHGMEILSRCHPDAKKDVIYQDGCLVVVCGECELPVLAVRPI